MMNKTRRMFGVWNIILLALAIIGLIYYDYRGGLWLKGITSSWFVLIGFVNLLYAGKVLALYLFGSGGKTADFLCMYTYWPGQMILAHSLFYYVNELCLANGKKYDIITGNG